VLRDIPCSIVEASSGAEGVAWPRATALTYLSATSSCRDSPASTSWRAVVGSGDPRHPDRHEHGRVLTPEDAASSPRAAAVLSKESYASGGAAAEIPQALEKVGFAALTADSAFKILNVDDYRAALYSPPDPSPGRLRGGRGDDGTTGAGDRAPRAPAARAARRQPARHHRLRGVQADQGGSRPAIDPGRPHDASLQQHRRPGARLDQGADGT